MNWGAQPVVRTAAATTAKIAALTSKPLHCSMSDVEILRGSTCEKGGEKHAKKRRFAPPEGLEVFSAQFWAGYAGLLIDDHVLLSNSTQIRVDRQSEPG